MKRVMFLLVSFLVMLPFVSCKKDNEEPEPEIDKIRFYIYNSYNGETPELGYYANWTQPITESLSILLEGMKGKYNVVLEDDDLADIVPVEDTSMEEWYQIIPKKQGATRLIITDEEGDQGILYLTIGSKSHIVDITKAEVEIDIEDAMIGEEESVSLREYLELIADKRMHSLPVIYTISFETPKDGKLSVRDSITTTGEFYLEKEENNTYYIFNYDNQTYRYRAKYDYIEPYYLVFEDDFTQEYQEQFSKFTINKLTIKYYTEYNPWR